MSLHSSLRRTILARSVLSLMLLLVLVVQAVAPSASTAQSAVTDAQAEADVRTTVETIVALEQEANGTRLYDMLAPHSRDLLPRQALVNWYASPASAIPVGEPEILAVEFGSWTWPVADETYPAAATVVYRVDVMQRGEQQRVVQEMNLVYDGSWTWFFGNSSSFVERVAAQNVASVAYDSPFDDSFLESLDTFWAVAFAEEGADYRSPGGVVPMDEDPFQTGCGWAENVELLAALYCVLDETIYYSPSFANDMERIYGPFGWETVVAHEWGHHVQILQGIGTPDDPDAGDGLYAMELELQADCLAGMFAQDGLANGELTGDDIAVAEAAMGDAGDVSATEWDNPGTHGTGEQRLGAFQAGYNSGFIGCDLDLTAD